jgi:hypothetical protein
MNTQIAREVIHILATADGGCPYCVGDLVEKFLQTYIGFFRWEVYDWIEEVDKPLAEALRLERAV